MLVGWVGEAVVRYKVHGAIALAVGRWEDIALVAVGVRDRVPVGLGARGQGRVTRAAAAVREHPRASLLILDTVLGFLVARAVVPDLSCARVLYYKSTRC